MVTEGGILILVRLLQLANAFSPIDGKPWPNVAVERREQPAKAFMPKLVIVVGILIELSLVHFSKALSPIICVNIRSNSCISCVFNFIPIVTKVVGKVMLDNEEHP